MLTAVEISHLAIFRLAGEGRPSLDSFYLITLLSSPAALGKFQSSLKELLNSKSLRHRSYGFDLR